MKISKWQHDEKLRTYNGKRSRDGKKRETRENSCVENKKIKERIITTNPWKWRVKINEIKSLYV